MDSLDIWITLLVQVYGQCPPRSMQGWVACCRSNVTCICRPGSRAWVQCTSTLPPRTPGVWFPPETGLSKSNWSGWIPEYVVLQVTKSWRHLPWKGMCSKGCARMRIFRVRTLSARARPVTICKDDYYWYALGLKCMFHAEHACWTAELHVTGYQMHVWNTQCMLHNRCWCRASAPLVQFTSGTYNFQGVEHQ